MWPHWTRSVLAAAMLGFAVLAVLLVIPFAIMGRLPNWSLPLAESARGGLHVAGIALSVAGLALLLIAQQQMGTSWRLNIDREDPGPLRIDGLYRICRNPVYASFGVMVLGLAVGLLSALSLVMLACLWIALVLQARQEEAFLSEEFGRRYDDYAARVGRFIPSVGRRVLSAKDN
jgi:protein-S-isoprenylcysteine O-methyltransferase Ste14